ncbi:MAG: hypothetical protein KC636_32970 [Myxococcales bacterium]|nr:hypothetical protein [Myxococcales bacterium]
MYILVALVALGLLVEINEYILHAGWLDPLTPALSLSYEQNLPTWYAASLLLLCAALLAVSARADPTWRRSWALLAVGFLYISMDEVVGVHEYASELFDTHGLLFFGWVIPAAVVVTVIGLAYLRFLGSLPAQTRRRFVVAGVIYVTGALALELPLGAWTERHGNDNLTYALIDLLEESLELLGATLFVGALLEHLRARVGSIALRIT